MSHEDGRCATVAEAIYVQNDNSICSDTVASTDPGAGTESKPLCSLQPVPTFLSSTRDLIVIRGTVVPGTWSFTGQGAPQTTVVGQQSALIAGSATPAFTIQGGSMFIRGLAISSSASDGIDLTLGALTLQSVTIAGSATSKVGISASGGALTTNNVTVDSCAGGGILLDGAAFDIENTTVTNNGPGAQGTSGGIVISSVPSSGSSVLHLVTIQDNKQVGITCAPSAPPAANGVYVSGNTGGEVAQTCGFSSCGALGPTCGAQ